ncbi:MAG: hypothetical protein ACT4PM_10850 [Gemmatimonadales bacterium]
MHLDDEVIQRLLHGEIPESSVLHLAECGECRRRLDQARLEEARIFALLEQADHPRPEISAASVAARPRSEAFRLRVARWAAVLLIGLGLAGAAYAIPGSPLRRWIGGLTRWISAGAPARRQPELPAPEALVTAGIGIAPGPRLIIRFASRAPGTLSVWATDGPEVAVRARGGTPAFTTEAQQLIIENRGVAADYDIEIPRRAPWVEIRTGARRLLLKQDDRIESDRVCHKPAASAVPLADTIAGDSAMRPTMTLIVALSLACNGSPTEPFEENLDISICHHSAGPFSATITNPYFPMTAGTRWSLEGGTTRLEITALDETEVVAGVATRVVEERETEGGALIEVSRNFFGQTQDGTVCYFGEDVDIYQGGVVVSHEGAWRAGAAGAVPGIFMPAQPAQGMAFRQEVAPGIAEDRVVIEAVNELVTVPFGTFTQTVRFLETTPLEPGASSTKVFARTLGPIVDDVLRLTGKTP